jgi:hypothetical protein
MDSTTLGNMSAGRTRTRRPSIARNPFGGKGLRVVVTLLMHPSERFTVTELATRAEVSQAMASGVIHQLRIDGALPDDGVQGRAAGLVASWDLLWHTALAWPAPDLGIVGPPGSEQLDRDGAGERLGCVVGGRPAWRRAGLVAVGVPRVYVPRWHDLDRLLVHLGGTEVASEDIADWTVSVLDLPVPPGPLPPLVAALELGTTARGRETLQAARPELLPLLDGT